MSEPLKLRALSVSPTHKMTTMEKRRAHKEIINSSFSGNARNINKETIEYLIESPIRCGYLLVTIDLNMH